MTNTTTLNRLAALAMDDANLKPVAGLEDAIALHIEMMVRPSDANGYVVHDGQGQPLKAADGTRVTDLVGLVRYLAQAKPNLFKSVETAGIAETSTASVVVRDVLDPPGIVNPWARATANLTERMRIARENPELAERLKARAAETDAGPNVTQLMLAAHRGDPGAAEALRAITSRNR